MKVPSGLLVMFFVALMFFIHSAITGSTIHGMFYKQHSDDGSTVTTVTRKLKVKRGLGTVNLEDYHPIDPVPSSKASVKPGPIEHGAPIIPYIPKPSPPEPPGRG